MFGFNRLLNNTQPTPDVIVAGARVIKVSSFWEFQIFKPYSHLTSAFVFASGFFVGDKTVFICSNMR